MVSKDFSYRVKISVDSDHPLYDEPDRIIRSELAILIMNGMSEDPMLAYECEVI
jgi:hypothetical protein